MDKQLLKQEMEQIYSEYRLGEPPHIKSATLHALTKAATSSSTVKELEREVEALKGILKEADDYLSEPIYENGKPVLYNNIGAGSILHNKFKTYNL